MISIEQVAQRNQLVLFRTSRLGQWKAHCPVCQDTGRRWHLYVSTTRDAFYCHKCGAQGGVIQFHAWLTGVSYETAKAELYPPTQRLVKRRVHPGETLTRAQLEAIGFVPRKPRIQAPNGVDPLFWAKRRRAELDWIWSEWQAYQRLEREHARYWARIAAAEGHSTPSRKAPPRRS